MKKYLVPLLVLMLLLVSVTTVFADRFTHAYNDMGVCTFIQQPDNECETVFKYNNGFNDTHAYCAVGFPIFLKEKGKLSPFLPDWDSIWKCKVEGTYYVDTGGGDWGMDYVELEKVTLTEEITTP